ncbi:MAG: uroporphyrinogen decarboxylase, partial [Desulfobacteraceae bacterium]|nr:uroporphyrinogen decarboxylase [Desulfobacteraceae bacterium]
MELEWEKMPTDDKLEARVEACLSPAGVEFVSAESEEAYKERVTRFKKVIQLKTPDRVPVHGNVGFFPAYYAGITPEEAMYDRDKLRMAWKKYASDFEPDIYPGTHYAGPGKIFEMLDYKLYRWPGHGAPAETPYQFVESENMKKDEYDQLIQDPSYFMMKAFLPRISGALQAFSRLPDISETVELPGMGFYLLPFGLPEVQASLQTLMEAGKEALKWAQTVFDTDREVKISGIPLLTGGMTKAPFDYIGDTLRGTQNVILDMFRQPDKLLEAMDRITPLLIKWAVQAARISGGPIIFMPLHKGADGFMSEKQFKTFYWPTLKKVILGLIEEGLVPQLFAEGSYDSRLEIISDLPRGKVIWKFDATD